MLRKQPVDPLEPMARVPLGKSGLRVSRIGMGTGVKASQRQSNHTKMGRETFEWLLRFAFDHGINYFDLADLYGSHPYLGRALKGIPREDYVLVSKIWWRPGGIPEKERPDADVVVKRFLQEIGTEYIDLVHLHCVEKADWNVTLRRQMDLLDGLKESGTIRAHGVSVHHLDGLATAAAEPWVDAVHTRINHLGVKMDGPPEMVVPVLRRIHAAGKGVTGMKVCGEGQFRTSGDLRTESIRFVLGLGCVDAMIVGFEKASEIFDWKSRVVAALDRQPGKTG